MIGLASARTRCALQRQRVRQARTRLQWWQAQTCSAAARAATSPPALLAAAAAGWWVGRRRPPHPPRSAPTLRLSWQSARHLLAQALRAWAFWRGLQLNLARLSAGRARPPAARPAAAPGSRAAAS